MPTSELCKLARITWCSVAFLVCASCSDRESLKSTPHETRVVFDNETKWEITTGSTSPIWRIKNGPKNCQVLSCDPSIADKTVATGKWVVVCPAIFSASDVSAVPIAMRIASTQYSGVALGIRPFDEYTQPWSWYPETKGKYSSPVWVGICDGRIVYLSKGEITEEEIRRFFAISVTKFGDETEDRKGAATQ